MVIQESHACEIKERLRLLAEKTRKFQNQKIPKLHSLRPFHFSRRRRTEPEAPCTPAGHVDPVAEIIPAMTTTTVGSRESRVLAILDTGASRCVMGANLLNRFVRQFGEDIRSKIRVMPSSVRFRFGNNQTLTSQKRLLLPLLASQDTWWLSIEIVPGSTLSKKALKQLGSTLDTRRDSLQLHKLHREISLSTGPTGLYMLDLPDLCSHDVRDASETPRCERALHVCSAKSEPPLQCNAKPEPPLHVSTVQAHMSLELGSGMSVARKFGMNSFPSKYPGSDNVLSELGSDDPPDCQHLGTEPIQSKTHCPSTSCP